MIVIVDYGVGNLGSLARAIHRAGGDAKVSSSPGDIAGARGLILPGVGAYGAAMDALGKRDLLPTLSRRVLEDKTPLLGICLGMQLLFSGSEEGPAKGLGWMEGKNKRLRPRNGDGLRVPHMGWNEVHPRPGSALFAGLGPSPHFYFCHSFCADAADEACAAAHTDYGARFVSAVEKDNLFGVQFHPERSQENGLFLLRNFLKIALCSNQELSPACS